VLFSPFRHGYNRRVLARVPRQILSLATHRDVKRSPSIHIGTSGWHYAHWRGPFYPESLAPGGFLKHYFSFFHTVEINNSFYQLPREKTLIQWRDAVPAGFIFAVKASRFITHMKKLKDPEKSVPVFLDRMRNLGDSLGPILFQLPPYWKLNRERFGLFLEKLPKNYRYSFEFRDSSWFQDAVYQALADHGSAFCIYDLNGKLSPLEVTADFVYVRLHGPEGPYRGQYGPRALSGWARLFSDWVRQDKEIYCYFDNDEGGYAPRDALTLQKAVGKESE